jgi:predicted Fe-S protein YdhL (DUF1289 family)
MTEKIKSPCVGICEYGEINLFQRICRGCYRTAEEIEEWIYASEEKKKDIMKSVSSRQNQ